MSVKPKKSCRMCGKNQFKTVINMGKNPLVNSLVEKEDLDKEQKSYPLVVSQCYDCMLVQIVNPIKGDAIYQAQDYLYFTGDMPTTDAYFADLAREISSQYMKTGEFIVEIGSNDGTFLKNFLGNYRTLGVDPSKNVVLRALSRGILTLSDFFSSNNAKNIVREFGKAKVICGFNCIAHLDNLRDLMSGVLTLLQEDGVFVVECNYWGAMVKNKNYSLIYHDHYSYFSAGVWENFLKEYGMEVFDAYVTPAQGGSLRLFISRKGNHKKSKRCEQVLSEENITNLNTSGICGHYRRNVLAEAKKLKELVVKLKSEGKKIAGYGAAAKGFSVLKLAEIDQTHIDYFVDDSPAKQGKYTPVTHIPVISRKEAESKLPDYFFITAPNYEQVIVDKEKEFQSKGGKFLTVDARII